MLKKRKGEIYSLGYIKGFEIFFIATMSKKNLGETEVDMRPLEKITGGELKDANCERVSVKRKYG